MASSLRYLRRLEELSMIPKEHLVDIDFQRFPGLFDKVKTLNLDLSSSGEKPSNGIIISALRHFQRLEKLSIKAEFSGKEEQIQLVEFLQGSATVLEEFYLTGRQKNEHEGHEHISRLYRASPDVQFMCGMSCPLLRK
ncbi:hypothetical protein QJS10_CPA08g00016 [Acorus calamus]|uniref:FBD domain-containing protein n=1 Tax=Acorus calamus TaxID=4465 RepID=A0AAV9EF35_ACOCL|nr:hypothetical protein QJS10_CPA08g00016 [Acorus calamus]